MKPLSRRSVTAGLAAAMTVPAATLTAPALGAAASEGGELARLVHRYFAEVAAFNADPRVGDDHFFHAQQAFDETLKQMIGVPIRCPEDALAGVEWLIDLGRDNMIELGGGSPDYDVAGSIVNEIRDYLAKQI